MKFTDDQIAEIKAMQQTLNAIYERNAKLLMRLDNKHVKTIVHEPSYPSSTSHSPL